MGRFLLNKKQRWILLIFCCGTESVYSIAANQPVKTELESHSTSPPPYIGDQRLRQLVFEAMGTDPQIPEELKAVMRPEWIGGILAAEKKRWGLNDNLPSLPDPAERALFAMKMPIQGVQEQDLLGWITAIGFAGAMIFPFVRRTPADRDVLGPFIIGIFTVEILYGTLGAILPNPNTSVGRGQIKQRAWNQALQYFAPAFPVYLRLVEREAHLKTPMRPSLEQYQLNDISTKYNPMDRQNIKILDNFMIGAVLLQHMLRQDQPYQKKQDLQDKIKYGIAFYHGTSAITLRQINRILGLRGQAQFPPEQASQNAKLSSKEQDIIRYVYEVYHYGRQPQ